MSGGTPITFQVTLRFRQWLYRPRLTWEIGLPLATMTVDNEGPRRMLTGCRQLTW